MFIRTINKTANKILLLLVMVKYLQNNLECKFGMLLQKKIIALSWNLMPKYVYMVNCIRHELSLNDVCKKDALKNLLKIHRKVPVLESLKVAYLRTAVIDSNLNQPNFPWYISVSKKPSVVNTIIFINVYNI